LGRSFERKNKRKSQKTNERNKEKRESTRNYKIKYKPLIKRNLPVGSTGWRHLEVELVEIR
jgi:hypothetical protein